MQEVILLRGLPASGKSTWAKQQIRNNPGKYKRVNKDDLRAMLDDSQWTKSNETFVERFRDHIIVASLVDGKSVIVDDTNINPKHEVRVKEIIESYSTSTGKDVNFIIKEFVVPISELYKRDGNREAAVGKVVINRMLKQWKTNIGDYIPGEYISNHLPSYKWLKYLEDTASLPGAYVFDMDGTLSLLNGRNPYDGSTADNDLVNVPVVTLLNRLHFAIEAGEEIIIMSGRDSKYKDETLLWLDFHKIPYDELFMRTEGDQRKDAVIKKELYEEHIKGKFRVLGIFDDRPQVRRMWINEGLFVFSCYQDPNFIEF